MTTFTRPSRLDKRDAYLIAKHGDDVKALLSEMREHAIREPFDPKTASFAEMEKRFADIRIYSNDVLRKFPHARLVHFHDLSGTPIAFIPQDSQLVEVVLRKRPYSYAAKREDTPYTYYSVKLPVELFRGCISTITSYTRKTLRANFEVEKQKAQEAAEAERKRLAAERQKLDRDIAAAEKKLEQLRAKKKPVV